MRRIHGEALSADEGALQRSIPAIQAKVAQKRPRDVWNADEFGLFYRQPPGWTLSMNPVYGYKKEKSRISEIACCNSDGSEKFSLMFIGKAQRPRPFRGKFGHQIGLEYHNNYKAWMTQTLFFAWLLRLNQYVRQTPNRHIILFVDNCSAHGTYDNLPALSNVEVYFLLPNTTSRVQPLDAGIIAKVKRKFKMRLLRRIFENIEVGKKSIYNIDILTVMRWVSEEWDELSLECINNCFKNCFKQTADTEDNIENGSSPGTVQSNNVIMTVDGVRQQMGSELNGHNICFSRVAIDSLFNPAGEDDVAEELNLEDQAAFVAGIDNIVEESADIEDDDVHLSLTEELKALEISLSALERLGHITKDAKRALSACQAELRVMKQSGLNQTSITDFFYQLINGVPTNCITP